MISILAQGNWGRGHVVAEWAGSSRLILPEVERLIEASWTAAARRGVTLFDGPMCRLERWDASGDCLRLVLSPTSYRIFVGTNLSHPHLADAYGSQAMANPVGVSAALLTADGYLMLGRRNAAVAYYPNRIHPFAGTLEPGDGVDVFSAIERELQEELALTSEDIAEMACWGIVEDAALRQPELIFKVRSTRTRREIEAQVDEAEHTGCWAIASTEESIARSIRDPGLTPVGVGALLLWGKSEFGKAFQSRVERI